MKKKKKTPKKTSTQPSSRKTLDPDLPIIKIVSEEEEMHVKLGLEMEDETHEMLVKWGKEVASDEDYINIAISDGIKHYIHRADASDNIDSLNKEDTLPLV